MNRTRLRALDLRDAARPARSLGCMALIFVLAASPRFAFAQTPNQPVVPPSQPDLGGTRTALAAVFTVLSILPGEGGIDLGLSQERIFGPRAIVAWPLQIPIPIRSRTGTVTYSHHRVVLSPGMAIAEITHARPGLPPETAWVTFVGRVGYRYVRHFRASAFGGLVGLGHSFESWPVFRPTIGIETGLHLGACCGEAAFIVTIIARADFYFALDDRVRLSFAAGWAFY